MKSLTPWILSVLLMSVVATSGFSVEPDKEKEAAIAAIKKLGGEVTVDRSDPNLAVMTVRLSGSKVTDDGLKHLRVLTRLKNLALNNTKITDVGLEHLKGMASLRELNLRNTMITDEGVKKLKEALPKCRIHR